MSNSKGPTEGGSGGKRGHSNMEHWTYTEEIKKTTKVNRRVNGKREIKKEIERVENKEMK